MSTPQQFRTKAAECVELVKSTQEPEAIREFQRQARSFTDLANNQDWLANNAGKTVPPMDKDADGTLAEDEERILRRLGAAVIMQWNTLPTKLQKELFENASAVGDLLQTGALKGQIARFLHNHKDDEAAPQT
jgi:hypothetical protein